MTSCCTAWRRARLGLISCCILPNSSLLSANSSSSASLSSRSTMSWIFNASAFLNIWKQTKTNVINRKYFKRLHVCICNTFTNNWLSFGSLLIINIYLAKCVSPNSACVSAIFRSNFTSIKCRSSSSESNTLLKIPRNMCKTGGVIYKGNVVLDYYVVLSTVVIWHNIWYMFSFKIFTCSTGISRRAFWITLYETSLACERTLPFWTNSS